MRSQKVLFYRAVVGAALLCLAAISSYFLLPLPPKEESSAPVVLAQVAGNGGTENLSVLYYRTANGQPVNVSNPPTCPSGWTQALDGYGPHYIALINYDWLSGGTGGTGGGWGRPDDPPTIIIPPPPTECFTGDTPILLAGGAVKPIRDITIGDQVLSFNERGEVSAARVIDTIRHEYSLRRINLLAGGVRIETTMDHRFWQGGDIFTPAGELEVGDTVYQYDLLSKIFVARIITWIEKVSDNQPVYNFSVADTHTYIANGFAVHNTKPSAPPTGGGGPGGGGNGPSGGGGGNGGSGDGGGGGGGGSDSLPSLKPKGETLADVFTVMTAKAQTSYVYTLTSIGIGSDSICSQSQQSVVKVVPFYLNATTTNQVTMYSDACSTDPTTGILECNKCLVCYK